MAVLSRRLDRRNPILWQESTHQQRSSPRAIHRWRFAGPLALIVLIGLVGFTLSKADYPSRDTALYLTWFIHAIVTIRAIIAGANVISREHVGQTWDALVLTGVSTRQILLGKWGAALRRVGPWMVALGTLRLAMLPIFMLAYTNRIAWRYTYYNSSAYDLPTIEWVPWASIVAVIGTVALTGLEMMAGTALGMAASALTRRGMLAMAIASTVRFAPVAIFAGFTLHEVGPSRSWRVLRFPAFALADSGTSPLTQLMLPRLYWSWTRSIHMDALPGVLLAAGLLAVFTVASLFAAWAAIRYSGALPHPKDTLPSSAFRAIS